MKAFTPSIKMINDFGKTPSYFICQLSKERSVIEGSDWISSPHTDLTGNKNGKCGRRKDKATALEQIYPKD